MLDLFQALRPQQLSIAVMFMIRLHEIYVLRGHPWSCAKKRTILAPITTYPAFGYSHTFPLPRDFSRLIDAGQCKYEIENRHILADSEQSILSIFTTTMKIHGIHFLSKQWC